MNLLLLLCLGLVFHCIDGQMAHDVDILNELKKLQKTQEECTKKLSELDEYKVRVLSLENKVKDLQDAVKDLESENKEIHRHRLVHDRRQTSELNVNNYETKTERAVEGFPSVDNRRVLNSTHLLQGNVDTSMKKNVDRIRSAIKRSFAMRPKPTNTGPTNPGQTVDTNVAFTVTLSPSEVNIGDHSTVIFDTVITNIGSAYQPNTGIFIAPLKGAYVFSLTITVMQGQELYLQLFKDGSFVNYIFADCLSNNSYISTTKEWILEVKKGSQVWIRGSRGKLYGNSHSMWSGYLLFETT